MDYRAADCCDTCRHCKEFHKRFVEGRGVLVTHRCVIRDENVILGAVCNFFKSRFGEFTDVIDVKDDIDDTVVWV